MKYVSTIVAIALIMMVALARRPADKAPQRPKIEFRNDSKTHAISVDSRLCSIFYCGFFPGEQSHTKTHVISVDSRLCNIFVVSSSCVNGLQT
jgi:hypothetical protein